MQEIMDILQKDMESKPRDSHILMGNAKTGESVDYSIRTSFPINRDKVEELARKRLRLGKKDWSVIAFYQKRVWGF
jgi:hypothetical protein